MAEYIEKVAFNYAIREAVKKYPNSFYNGLEVARQIAHDLPAADVRPVVRGYWHGEGDGYADGELVCDMWQCGCCGEWFDEWNDKPTWNFCPNCGADMRETDDEKT